MTVRQTKTPIAVFSYNRSGHVQRLLKSLSRCDRLEECHVVIYCDGPKTIEQEAAVAASREIVRQWAGENGAKVVERELNLGLARSIVTGVTELCDQYGRVIVLEDDLVVSPDFLDYMLQALDRYKDSENVYQVSGYMFPVDHSEKPGAFFLPLTTTWGWATWERAWRIFDWQAEEAVEMLADPKIGRKFNLDNSYPYTAMLKDRLAGKNDSWGILFWWAVFNANGLVLHPRKSLVWQGGFDGSGVHCGNSAVYNKESATEFNSSKLSAPIEFPKKVAPSIDSLKKIENFHRDTTRVKQTSGLRFRTATSRFLPDVLKHQIKLLIDRDLRLKCRELVRLRKLPRFQSGVTDLLDRPLRFVDAASFLSAYYQIFEREIYDFLPMGPKPYILDCGANIGLSTIYWKQKFSDAEIIAFEPDPQIFQVLAWNCQQWGLSDIKLIDKAVWYKSGKQQFISDGADAGRLIDGSVAPDNSFKVVETVRLKDYIQRSIDLLKIDIEGAEADVLIDCADSLKLVDKLFVEYHSFTDREQRIDKILSILRSAGFRIHMQPELVSNNPFIKQLNNAGMDQRLNIFAYRKH